MSGGLSLQIISGALAIAGPLAGVVLGFVAAEMRTALQGGRDREKALRKLLFELLDLRFELKRRDPDAIVLFASESLAKIGAFDATSAPDAQATLVKVVQAARSALPESGGARTFGEAVRAIAPFDPLLAYRLAGSESHLNLEGQLNQYFESILQMPEVVSSSNDAVAAETVQAEILKFHFRRALKELGDDVLKVALALSPWSWIRARRVIARQDAEPTDAMDNELKSLLIQALAQAAKIPPPPPTNSSSE